MTIQDANDELPNQNVINFTCVTQPKASEILGVHVEFASVIIFHAINLMLDWLILVKQLL